MLITWCSLNLQSVLKRFFCPLTLLHPKTVLPGKTFHLLRHNTYHLPRSTAIQDKSMKPPESKTQWPHLSENIDWFDNNSVSVRQWLFWKEPS